MKQKQLQDILTPEVIGVSPATPVIEAVEIMRRKKISCILIFEDKILLGIFTERNIVQAAATHGTLCSDWPIEKLMHSPVLSAQKETDIYSAYNLLNRHKMRHLVVVDHENRPLGVVTQSNIIEYLGFEHFIEFKKIRQIMTRAMMTLPKTAILHKALLKMAETSTSCLIITEDNRPLGILTERDVARFLLESCDVMELTVEEVMTSPVHTTLVEQPVIQVANLMKEKNIRRVVVVDHDGLLQGVTTQSDIISELEGKYIEELKEVVREKNLEIQKAQEELTQKTVTLDNILHYSMEIGIIASDLEHRITYFNPFAEQLFDSEAEEVVGRDVRNILARCDIAPPRFEKAIRAVKNNTTHAFTFEWDGDQGEQYFNVRISGIWDKEHKLQGHVLMLHDISRRRLNEKKINRQRADLEKVNTELSTLLKVSSTASRSLEVKTLLKEVLDVILSLDILAIEPKGGFFIIKEDTMQLVCHHGHSEAFVDLHKDMKIGDCLCGLAASTGEIILSEDCTADERHTIQMKDTMAHGHIILPLKAQEEVVGVLYLYTTGSHKAIDQGKLNLLTAIGNQIGIAIKNAQLYEEKKFLSFHDSLTKVANRRFMDFNLEDRFLGAKRYGNPLSLIMLDIDYFKKFNDKYGHHGGDAMLAQIARLILDSVRDSDFVARYGGEEFVVILPETELLYAQATAERIRKMVESESGVTISLGVTQYDKRMNRQEDLLSRADEALYLAKSKGRNRVEVTVWK